PKECTARPFREPEEAEQSEQAEPEEPAPPPKKAPKPQKEPIVAVTNKTKVLFPEDGYTKSDLVGYYEAIAPAMLRYLRDRPIMMVRYPDGIRGKMFYQWNVPTGVAEWVRTCQINDEKGTRVEVFLVDDVRTLMYVANLAAIPIHILAARVPDLAQADFLTID